MQESETGNTQTAIQQTLGTDFDAVEVETIIAEAGKPEDNEQPVTSVEKTNRPSTLNSWQG